MFEQVVKIDGRKTVVRVFDSVSEAVDTAVDGYCKVRREAEGFVRLQDAWVGRSFAGYDDLKKKATEPWSDGLAVVADMERRIEQANIVRPESRRRRRVWSETDGDEVCVDRLRSGQPYWSGSRRRVVAGPATITVVADLSTSSDVPHRDILWRGAAALVLAKRLEGAGYRVELWAAFRSQRAYVGGTDCFVAYRLKRPDQPLDVSRLVTAVAGWFFRTIGFATICYGDREPRFTLGSPRPRQPALDWITRDRNRILVDGVWSLEEAVEFVNRALKEAVRCS